MITKIIIKINIAAVNILHRATVIDIIINHPEDKISYINLLLLCFLINFYDRTIAIYTQEDKNTAKRNIYISCFPSGNNQSILGDK